LPVGFSESHFQARLFAEDEVNMVDGDERGGPDALRVLARDPSRTSFSDQ